MGLMARSAALVAWTNAWLLGEVALLDVVRHVETDDEPHMATGGDLSPGTTLTVALATVATPGDGTALRLALPAPGDPLGLTGPGSFSDLALELGEGAVVVNPTGLASGWVPIVDEFGPPGDVGYRVAWNVMPTNPPLPGAMTLAEADRALKEGLLEASEVLGRLDVGRWRPEAQELLRAIRTRRGEQVLPPPYGERAQDVAGRSIRLLAVYDLAATDDGAAITSHTATARRLALEPLARVARHGLVAAVDSVLEPGPR